MLDIHHNLVKMWQRASVLSFTRTCCFSTHNYIVIKIQIWLKYDSYRSASLWWLFYGEGCRNDGRSQYFNRCPSPPLLNSPSLLSCHRWTLHETSERDWNYPILTYCSVTSAILRRIVSVVNVLLPSVVLLINSAGWIQSFRRDQCRYSLTAEFIFARLARAIVSCPYLPGEIFSRAWSVIFNRAPKFTYFIAQVRPIHPTNCQK